MPSTCAERCCVSASWWWTAMCSTDWETLTLSRCVKTAKQATPFEVYFSTMDDGSNDLFYWPLG